MRLWKDEFAFNVSVTRPTNFQILWPCLLPFIVLFPLLSSVAVAVPAVDVVCLQHYVQALFSPLLVFRVVKDWIKEIDN